MPNIRFIDSEGNETPVEAADGESVMHAAMGQGLDGIAAECGGALMCATCHVYVEEKWLGDIPEKTSTEEAMLESVSAPIQPNSRLSCQIVMNDRLDGLVVRVPEVQ